MLKKGITYFILGIITMIWLWLFFLKSSISEYSQVEVLKTDTIYVNKPYKEIVIKEVEIQKPVKVFIYKTDTVFRQKLEKDTLISAIQIEPKKATIHTITPKGIPLVKEYPIVDFKKLTIGHEGEVNLTKKKRKTMRVFRRAVVFFAGFIAGSIIKYR
tara:strand:- start:209 stop:682 length:474 start_codon:yes stop_codon:yes gene_type:complete